MNDIPKDYRRWKGLRAGLDVIATLSMIVAAVAMVRVSLQHPSDTNAGRELPVPSAPISLHGVPVQGSEDAKVGAVEFSDFQCPYCGQFARDVWPVIKSEYVDTGRVRIAFRHLPLTRIHSEAWQAAEAAECAFQQGRFWEMHDALFTDPRDLTAAALDRRVMAIGLNPASFASCLRGTAKTRIEEDAAMAAKLGIRGTPTLLVGHVERDGRLRVRRISAGARSVADIRALLDGVLAEAERGS